jgi:hypothetical protein
VVRVVAPKVEVALPPVPEFTAEQLLLCRHLTGKYLANLSASTSAVTPAEQDSGEAAEGAAQGAVAVEVETMEAGSAPAAVVSEDLVRFVQALIETIDQALIAVAVRAEAAEQAAAAAAAAAPAPAAGPPAGYGAQGTAMSYAGYRTAHGTAMSPAAPVGYVTPGPAGQGTSIIPAAPSTSYVAGRVGNGYAMAPRRGGRTQALAPRQVPHAGKLPMVEVKMEGKLPVVQNQREVAEALAARRAQPTFVAEAPVDIDGIPG